MGGVDERPCKVRKVEEAEGDSKPSPSDQQGDAGDAGGRNLKPHQLNRRTGRWSRQEVEALHQGYSKYEASGRSVWKKILTDPELGKILAKRSNVDLKDKWRGLQRGGSTTPHRKGSQISASRDVDNDEISDASIAVPEAGEYPRTEEEGLAVDGTEEEEGGCEGAGGEGVDENEEQRNRAGDAAPVPPEETPTAGPSTDHMLAGGSGGVGGEDGAAEAVNQQFVELLTFLQDGTPDSVAPAPGTEVNVAAAGGRAAQTALRAMQTASEMKDPVIRQDMTRVALDQQASAVFAVSVAATSRARQMATRERELVEKYKKLEKYAMKRARSFLETAQNLIESIQDDDKASAIAAVRSETTDKECDNIQAKCLQTQAVTRSNGGKEFALGQVLDLALAT